jgi:hypothetical protein
VRTVPSLVRVACLSVPPPLVARRTCRQEMELDTILNARLTAYAGTGPSFAMQHAMQHEMQQQQHFGAPPYINSRIKSETGSERGVSPHPSDSSRYSSQQPQQPLPSYPAMPQHMADMRYPSPAQMQAPMPMLNNNNYIPNPPEHAYAQQQQVQVQEQIQHHGGRPASDTGPPKAFACSTCGKGFARRSDLARHGKELGPQHQSARTDFPRTYPQRHPPARVRLSQLRQAVYPALCPDRPPACPHGREAPHV